MKISIVMCVFLALHCYGRSVVVKRDTSCKPVDYDLAMVEFNQFVTNEIKAEVCAKSIEHYNFSSRIPIKYLGGEYNYITHANPCTVVCRFDPTAHQSIVNVNETVYTLIEYRSLQMTLLNIAEKTVCGPQHLCNVNGCCVKDKPEDNREQETQLEDSEIELQDCSEAPQPELRECNGADCSEAPQPELRECNGADCSEAPQPELRECNGADCSEAPQPELRECNGADCSEAPQPELRECNGADCSEAPQPELRECNGADCSEAPQPELRECNGADCSEAPQPELRECNGADCSEAPETEISEIVYNCKDIGMFSDNNDETSFFICSLKSAHIKCAIETVFNKESKQCEAKNEYYDERISCTLEGYFTNPYDMNRFYRCYYNDAAERDARHLRIAFYACAQSMVFDNTAQTCVMPTVSSV